MTRDFERLGHGVFDLLVVGGGVYGLATAYDAARRGLSVALVERDDFGGRTSFNHHKTIHGGLRHLQRGHLLRMREAILERRAFARIAPQFLAPQPFVVPTRRSLTRSAAAMRAALALDRAIGFDRNAGLPPALALPPGRVLGRAELAELLPEPRFEDATGAALWHDYLTEHSERLTLAFALAAARHGAVLANYAEAVAPCREGMQITGMQVRDGVTGEACVVRARVTCNAAGAAAGRVMAGFGIRRPFPLIKAMNLVTRRPAWRTAVGSPTRGGRLLVALPWHGRLAIGTSHGDVPAGADDVGVDAAELDAFLGEIDDAFPGLGLSLDDIALVHRGVVPARVRRGRAPELLERSIVLDHAADGVEGAVSLVGVKYTTARLIAERVVDRVLPKVGLGPVESQAAGERLVPHDPGEGAPSALAAVASLYEPAALSRMRSLAAERPGLADPLAPGAPVCGAQVLEAVRHEMALSLEDVVLRRTSLGTAGYPGDEAVGAAAALMREELGWSDARVADEIESVRRRYEAGPATAS